MQDYCPTQTSAVRKRRTGLKQRMSIARVFFFSSFFFSLLFNESVQYFMRVFSFFAVSYLHLFFLLLLHLRFLFSTTHTVLCCLFRCRCEKSVCPWQKKKIGKKKDREEEDSSLFLCVLFFSLWLLEHSYVCVSERERGTKFKGFCVCVSVVSFYLYIFSTFGC